MKIHLYCLRGPYPEYYCGKAKNLPRRIQEHRTGNGSKHTKPWKDFEVFRTAIVDVKTESEAYLAEASFTRQMRDELPGMRVFGPGDQRFGKCWQKKKKNPGSTFHF